jgi:hypothetical protein
MHKPKNDLSSTIKNINLSHLFAHKLNHGISKDDEKWKLFEPTKFIYSYFTFAMIYEIDWKESLKTNKVWDYRSEQKKFSSHKIYHLLNFINQYIDSNMFYNYLIKYTGDLKLIENSLAIKEDNKIKIDRVKKYRNSLEKLKDNIFDIDDHYEILFFTHKIRNNIFHGYKKATEMIRSGQRRRLLDYSDIILATNEMFFDVLAENYDYEKAQIGEMKENAGI